jgi:hypothetical protein
MKDEIYEEDLIENIAEEIEKIIKEFKQKHWYGLFSSGGDNVTDKVVYSLREALSILKDKYIEKLEKKKSYPKRHYHNYQFVRMELAEFSSNVYAVFICSCGEQTKIALNPNCSADDDD